MRSALSEISTCFVLVFIKFRTGAGYLDTESLVFNMIQTLSDAHIVTQLVTVSPSLPQALQGLLACPAYKQDVLMSCSTTICYL